MTAKTLESQASETAFVVKVQLSLGDGGATTLVKGGPHILWQGPTSADVRELMAGRNRAFFHAHMEGTLVSLDEEAGKDMEVNL